MDLWAQAAKQAQVGRQIAKTTGFALMYGKQNHGITERNLAETVARMLLAECMADGEDREDVIRERLATCWEAEDNKFWPNWAATLEWAGRGETTAVLDVKVTYRSAVDRLGDVTREEG